VDASVIICTHNRSAKLRQALGHLLAQKTDRLLAEIIVVDNNSTDDTAEVVREAAAGAQLEIRYSFQAAQGISFARNTGWGLARGSVVAFTDDDVRVEPDWLRQIVTAFSEHPDIDCVGGKVLPEWPARQPAWLTREHWTPLAILDYGDAPIVFDASDPRCLIGANVAFRRDLFQQIGGFSPAVQRVKDGIGSIEDHEFLIRLWNSGRRALYLPQMVVVAPVDLPRMEKGYHRRWHYGHGHFYAVMRAPSVERSSAGRFLDVPAHLYRQCLSDLVRWSRGVLRGRFDEAFAYEARLHFFRGFFETRRRDYIANALRRGADAKRHAAAVRHSGGAS
jgi:glycosyltransferase involved in cell wall biosynthesis